MDSDEINEFLNKVCRKLNKVCKYSGHSEYEPDDFEYSGLILKRIYHNDCTFCSKPFKEYKNKFMTIQLSKYLTNIIERLDKIENEKISKED